MVRLSRLKLWLVIVPGSRHPSARPQEHSIATMAAEIKILKSSANRRDQLDRALTVRLFNFPGSDSETGLSNRIYERILKPILVAAKAKGTIPSVPQASNVISECDY